MAFSPLKYLARVRRTRGFGVHSPFAYRFITTVWHQKSAYYAYAVLHERRSRKLFRMINFFNPGKIEQIGTPLPEVNVTFDVAVGSSGDASSNMLVVNALEFDETAINSLLSKLLAICASAPQQLPGTQVVIMFPDMPRNSQQRRVWNSLVSRRRGGMAFADRQTGVIVCRRGLPAQNFSLVS